MMNNDLHVAVFQHDVLWLQPSENMRSVSDMLSRLDDVDLCVLPEMWTTGFVTEPAAVADMEERTVSWMCEQAKSLGMALCGSVCVGVQLTDGDRYYNRMYFVCPDGGYVSYDKHHLFTMGGEHKQYTPGDKRVIVSYKGLRFLLCTCYDLRFPVWLRNTEGYDGMIVCANWPTPRRRVWDILLQARALENQCYVIAANRIGKDDKTTYNGGSIILDARGKTLAAAADNKEECITTTISSETRQSFVARFNTLADGDRFEWLTS